MLKWGSNPSFFVATVSRIAKQDSFFFPVLMNILWNGLCTFVAFMAEIWNWSGLNKKCTGCKSPLPSSERRSQCLDNVCGFLFLFPSWYLITKSNSDKNSVHRAWNLICPFNIVKYSKFWLSVHPNIWCFHDFSWCKHSWNPNRIPTISSSWM